ncbi:MAG: 50S ribosomal protein L24 [Fimbriimonadaceae bacterium]|nr:50S ribosomal protein L24 [Fimbriimonadaceae bacterium]
MALNTAKPIRRPHQPNRKKAHAKKLAPAIKQKLRTGDQVVIIAGKDKGERGFIAAVAPREFRAIVLKNNPDNPDQPLPLNAAIKHRKAKMQNERSARVRIPVPIHLSNLMLIDPATNEPTRVGRRQEDGKLVRYGKKSGTTIPEPKLPE